MTRDHSLSSEYLIQQNQILEVESIDINQHNNVNQRSLLKVRNVALTWYVEQEITFKRRDQRSSGCAACTFRREMISEFLENEATKLRTITRVLIVVVLMTLSHR